MPAARVVSLENSNRLEERIEQLEDAMVVREQRLRAQFQAMETAVSQLRAQGSSLAPDRAKIVRQRPSSTSASGKANRLA